MNDVGPYYFFSDTNDDLEILFFFYLLFYMPSHSFNFCLQTSSLYSLNFIVISLLHRILFNFPPLRTFPTFVSCRVSMDSLLYIKSCFIPRRMSILCVNYPEVINNNLMNFYQFIMSNIIAKSI